MKSDESLFYIKIIVLGEVYNFIANIFFIWNYLERQNFF